MSGNQSKPQEPVITHSVARKAITQASTPLLLRIHLLPKFVVPVLIAGFMVLALFTSGLIGGIALTFVSIFIGWLMYLSWPLLDSRSRVLRFLVLCILISATAVKYVS
ncbi:MAG: DUF6703 family protein [Actinomycetes bacterium]|jgi:hypothetical protein